MAIGGDLRANFDATWFRDDDDNGAPDDEAEFDLQEALLYLQVELLPNRLSFYLDEQMAPGGASTREAYAMLRFRNGTAYLKAGRLFLRAGYRRSEGIPQDDRQNIDEVFAQLHLYF